MIFIVHGSDIFRRNLYISKLKSRFLEVGLEALNYSCIDKPSSAELITAASSPVFMGTAFRLIQEAPQLDSKIDSEAELKALLESLAEIPETVILVFSNTKLNGTIKLVKELKKFSPQQIEFQEFNSFKDWEPEKAADWILSLAEFNLDTETAVYFADYLGPSDSALLYRELERLRTLAPDKAIDRQLINSECKGRDNVFKLAKDLALGQMDSARAELARLKANGELHLGTLAALSFSINKYLKLKILDQSPKHRSKEIQAEILALAPGALYYTKQDSANMRVSRLEDLSQALLRAERLNKAGLMSVEQLLGSLLASS